MIKIRQLDNKRVICYNITVKKSMNGGLQVELLKTILSIIISLSTVLTIFTGIVNKLFNNKLKPIEDKIERNRLDSIRQNMRLARHHVVTFAGELHRGRVATLEETEAIFEFIDTYENAIEELGIQNSFFVAEEEFIKEYYQSLKQQKKN